jgi:hypothetical protein
MIKRSVFLFALSFAAATAAHAQFSIGLSPGMQCPTQMRAGQGAVNGSDEINNLRGRLNHDNQEIERKKHILDSLNSEINKDRDDMRTVLNGRVVDSIVEHRRYKRNLADYQDCNWDGQTASAGNGSVDVVLPGGGASGDGGGDSNRIPPPQDFCFRPSKHNTWDQLAQDNGTVSDRVCEYNVGSWRGQPNGTNSSRCKDGLKDFYRLMDDKAQLETDIAQLDADGRNCERQLNRIQDEIAEGTYCPTCHHSDYTPNSSSSGSVVNSLLPMAGVLLTAGLNYYKQEQQRKQMERQRFLLNAGLMRGYPVMPGPGAYPSNAYPAITPGYMNVRNGYYGALPGGVGQGAFGCQGTNPAFDSPFAQSQAPFLDNGGDSLFTNPFQNMLNNPSMQNSMLMPGVGPGFLPLLGNGLQNQFGVNPMFGQDPMLQGPFAQSPMGNWMGNNGPGQNMFGPAMLPYLGQNQFFNGPYQFGNQQMPIFGVNGPAYLPYMNGGNPIYGGWQGLMNPSMMGGNNSALSNYYNQMAYMQSRLSAIQNSPMFGGAAPAVLPYPGPSSYSSPVYYGTPVYYGSPIYNAPGSIYNPVPTTGTGTVNVIRSR